MSKSILVIDTPPACIDCPCHFAHEDGTVHCGARKKRLPAEDVETYKPGWCPLVPMPEKKEVCGRYPQKDGIVPSYKVGYNACIEEMLGKGDGEERHDSSVYDVEGVIGRLEQELNTCVDYHRRYGYGGDQIYAYKNALQIVKSGDKSHGRDFDILNGQKMPRGVISLKNLVDRMPICKCGGTRVYDPDLDKIVCVKCLDRMGWEEIKKRYETREQGHQMQSDGEGDEGG